MNVGIFVSNIGIRPGEEEIISGHVQVPLHTVSLLKNAGHDVTIITTHIPPGRVLPACYPNGVGLAEISNPARQGDRMIREHGYQPGAQLVGLYKALRDLASVLKREKFDLLHFFGGNGTARLAGAFGHLSPRFPIVVTANTAVFPEPNAWLGRLLWKRIDCVLGATEYSCSQLTLHGIPANLIRHGVVRPIAEQAARLGPRKRHRVLFWREATWRNGGDLAIEVFRRLAPRYPDYHFDFALRPHWKQASGIEALAQEFPNIGIHMAPYESGPQLHELLAESICALQPFRAFTIHPQLSILESVIACVPVVACDVESTREIITDGLGGFVVPAEDTDALTQATEHLLRDPSKASEMGRIAAMEANRKWQWDEYVPSLLSRYNHVLASHRGKTAQ